MKNREMVRVIAAGAVIAALALAGGCDISIPQAAASVKPAASPSNRPGETFVGGIGLVGDPGFSGIHIGPLGQGDVQEPPLPLGNGIRPLMPSPESTSSGVLYFSRSSHYFLWVDSAQDHIWASHIGGSSGILAKSGQPARIDWSADGTYVAVSQGSAGPAQVLRLPPGQAAEEIEGFGDGVPGRLLPDVSGTWQLSVMPREGPATGWPTPGPFSSGNAFKLSVRPVGGAEMALATLEAPASGTWSPDSRYFCYSEYPGGDRLSGIDIKVFDRQASASTRISHLDTDRLSEEDDNLVWGPDRQVYFARGARDGTSGAVTVAKVPIDSRPATLVLLPISLGQGERLRTVRLSPDFSRVAFESSRPSTASVGNSIVGYEQATGIFIADLGTGRINRVAPGGHIVSWLPGGDLVASTGRQAQTRYYIVEASSGSVTP